MTFDRELLKDPIDHKLPEVIEEATQPTADCRTNEGYEGEDTVDGNIEPSPPNKKSSSPPLNGVLVKSNKSTKQSLSRSVSFAQDASLATTATVEPAKPWQPLDKDSNEWRVLTGELFKLDNIRNIYRTSVKKREHNGRARLFAVYLLYTLIIIITLGCSESFF